MSGIAAGILQGLGRRAWPACHALTLPTVRPRWVSRWEERQRCAPPTSATPPHRHRHSVRLRPGKMRASAVVSQVVVAAPVQAAAGSGPSCAGPGPDRGSHLGSHLGSQGHAAGRFPELEHPKLIKYGLAHGASHDGTPDGGGSGAAATRRQKPGRQNGKLRRLMDWTDPASVYPLARAVRRRVVLHVGPTNSGKTHHAVQALLEATTGVYAAPLRLLVRAGQSTRGGEGGAPRCSHPTDRPTYIQTDRKTDRPTDRLTD